ncbi:hypothetical protein HYX19_03190 [Candidatus Woesearchaeota archaeon]|nr:hypothetical protein [Candidatus Woesearchaeota archaeon]
MDRRNLIFGGLASLLAGCSSNKGNETKKDRSKESILEEKIKERQKQATDKNLYTMATTVAQIFGERKSESRQLYFSNDDSLIIEYNFVIGFREIYPEPRKEDIEEDIKGFIYYSLGTAGGVRVFKNGKLVFSEYRGGRRDISTYAPGTWEEELKRHYLKAQEVVERRMLEKKKEQEERDKREQKELLERFGLTEEDLK